MNGFAFRTIWVINKLLYVKIPRATMKNDTERCFFPFTFVISPCILLVVAISNFFCSDARFGFVDQGKSWVLESPLGHIKRFGDVPMHNIV